MKKNVLVLTSTFPRWEKDHLPPFVFELSRRLTNELNMHVLAPHCPGCRKEEIMDGIRVHRYRYAPEKLETLAYGGGISTNLRKHPLRSLLIIPFLLAQFASAVRIARKENIDLIHAHWIIPQGLVAIIVAALSRKDIPVMVTAHGADVYTRKGRIMSYLKRQVIDRCKKVTVVSRHMAGEVSKISKKCNPDVIPMGADLVDVFVPDPAARNSNCLVTVGRLVEKKGTIYLIDGFVKLLEKYPDLRLSVIGDGPEKNKLHNHASSLGVDDRIIFIGGLPQNELASYLQHASIAIFPFVQAVDGDQEGFGLVLIEAMGCACATISTDMPAIGDIVINRENGLTIDEKNADSIYSSVSWLLEHPEKQEELANAGRVYVSERFDWANIYHQYLSLLRKLLDD